MLNDRGIDLNNIPEEDDPMNIDDIPEDQDDEDEDNDVHRNLDPWIILRGPMNNRVRYGYPDNIKSNPTLFFPLMYKSLVVIIYPYH